MVRVLDLAELLGKESGRLVSQPPLQVLGEGAPLLNRPRGPPCQATSQPISSAL